MEEGSLKEEFQYGRSRFININGKDFGTDCGEPARQRTGRLKQSSEVKNLNRMKSTEPFNLTPYRLMRGFSVLWMVKEYFTVACCLTLESRFFQET
jgi:hypothetical protein